MVAAPRGNADSVTVFAPATVANVGVGFDVLGFALDGIGDRVTVRRTDGPAEVEVESIRGVVSDLPTDPRRNTASVALLALLDDVAPSHGFCVAVDKGIPLGSGMGGSAASAVGAVAAANRLLDRPLPMQRLLIHAAAGERAASGAPHADNVAPCLYGGMTAVVSPEPLEVVPIPVPEDLLCVLVHPHLRIETRDARSALRDQIGLAEHVAQSMKLSGFLAGCFRGDAGLAGRSTVDLIVEPQRARLIPGFFEAKAAALDNGALGFAIAGSGPSVFAWVTSEAAGRAIELEIRSVFERQGLGSDGWVCPIQRRGAEPVSSTADG